VPFDQVGYVVCHWPLSYDAADPEAKGIKVVILEVLELLTVDDVLVVAEGEESAVVLEIVVFGMDAMGAVSVFVLGGTEGSEDLVDV